MQSNSNPKKIIVSSTATRGSGTLTIYKQFLKHLPEHINGRKYIIFVHPSMPQPEIEGVEYIAINTENQLRRIIFDWYGCKKELDKRNIVPDAIVSLQNTGVRCLRNYPQLVYYHLSFPFFDYKYKLTKKNELILYLYKNIYPFFVKCSIDPSNTHMVAQIPFISEGIEKSFGLPSSHIHTLFPDVEKIDSSTINEYTPWSKDSSISHIVFPATAFRYKGHYTIIEALSILNKRGINNIKVHFTLSQEDYPELVAFAKEKEVENMVDFMGVVPHECLLQMLKSSIGLLFPSVIESLGLPLLEAAALGKPIAVSDLRYAHEVIGEYEGVQFIDPNRFDRWADVIVQMINAPRNYYSYQKQEGSSWDVFLELIDLIIQKKR